VTADRVIRGPYFEELAVGQVFDTAPEVTLTSGLAASHQSIVGDRLRLPLSVPLAREVTGHGPVAHPALVWDLAIGQSSVVTQNVRANLFYRELLLLRLPLIGDTLRTTTTIDELRQNTARPDRPATGLAVLHIVTTDQAGRTVLNFHRCAMIPLGDSSVDTGQHAELRLAAADLDDGELLASVADWTVPNGSTPLPSAGQRFVVAGADVVSGAPELSRLTLNIAAVHHDAVAAGGRRLVFGGHTIAVALARASRAIPGLLTVLGWHSCEHLAPVHEQDRLTCTIEIERAEHRAGGGRLLHLRSRVSAQDASGGDSVPVLDWRYTALAT
jgi:acyl dehydratase